MSAMRVANVKNMTEFFADYMRHDGDWGRPELVKLDRLFRASSNALHMRHVNAALEMANKIMHGHGIESVVGHRNSARDCDDVALYVNMGDTYASTIIYDCLTDKFYVGTWGDWYQWREENEDYGLKEDN